MPRKTAAVSAKVLCIPNNHAPVSSLNDFIQSYRVHVCLAVTCYLHFCQNDLDLLRATAVTRGWTDTKIRVSTESWPWRRKFSRHPCRDPVEPETWSRVCRSATEPSPLPRVHVCLAVTCHLHFWQNDQDLLRATAGTWRWIGYQNKSLHRKLTLRRKFFRWVSNTRPFDHESVTLLILLILLVFFLFFSYILGYRRIYTDNFSTDALQKCECVHAACVCACVRVCVSVREREGERERSGWGGESARPTFLFFFFCLYYSALCFRRVGALKISH